MSKKIEERRKSHARSLRRRIIFSFWRNGFLDNIRRGQQACYELIKAGYAPYCPWLDYQYSFIGPMTLEEYQAVSMAFVPKCDAMLVLERWEGSEGTRVEMEKATTCNIPLFFSLVELGHYRWERTRVVY